MRTSLKSGIMQASNGKVLLTGRRVQKGCRSHLQAEFLALRAAAILLASFNALIISGTPMGPSKGR